MWFATKSTFIRILLEAGEGSSDAMVRASRSYLANIPAARGVACAAAA